MNTTEQQEATLLVGIEEAARLLAISRTKTYELIAAGKLDAVKLGRRRMVRRDSLNDYVGSLTDAA